MHVQPATPFVAPPLHIDLSTLPSPPGITPRRSQSTSGIHIPTPTPPPTSTSSSDTNSARSSTDTPSSAHLPYSVPENEKKPKKLQKRPSVFSYALPTAQRAWHMLNGRTFSRIAEFLADDQKPQTPPNLFAHKSICKFVTVSKPIMAAFHKALFLRGGDEFCDFLLHNKLTEKNIPAPFTAMLQTIGESTTALSLYDLSLKGYVEPQNGCITFLQNIFGKARQTEVITWSKLVDFFPKLTHLNATNCSLDELSLTQIGRLRHLKRLAIRDDQQITDRGIECVAPGVKATLEILDLEGCTRLARKALVAIGTMQHLTSLSLTGCTALQNEYLSQLTPLTELREFSARNCEKLGSRGFQKLFKHLPHLCAVDLNNTEADNLAVRQLANRATQLHTLYVSHTQVTDDITSILQDMRELSSLDVSANNFTDEGIFELSSIVAPRIKSLNISKTKISDEAFQWLKKFVALRYLDLSFTPITTKSMPAVAHLRLRGVDVVLNNTLLEKKPPPSKQITPLEGIREESTSQS